MADHAETDCPGRSFTTDWAGPFRENAERLFDGLAPLPLSYLEIGVYEGRSACWMLDNVLTHPLSLYVGVDVRVQDRGWVNLAPYGDKAVVYEGDSKVVVPRLNLCFDIVYIDGNHMAKDTLFDSVAAWQVLVKGGVLLWDDYVSRDKSNGVAKAVKAFLSCLRKREYEVLLENEQFSVRKR